MSRKNIAIPALTTACLVAALLTGGMPRLALVAAAAALSAAGLAIAIADRRKGAKR